MGSIFCQQIHLSCLIIAIIFSSIAKVSATTIPVGENSKLNKIILVSQLTDITRDSWAFQALQALIEQYDCVSQENTDNQSMTRYEFATKLNACILKINNSNFDKFNRETLTTIQKLQTEFSAELAIFSNRINLLENKISALETQQFSPQVELEGEIIFAVSGVAGGKKIYIGTVRTTFTF
ncbi:iron uptake porin [Anabaena sp. CCY 9402-a]|uniref:iron uptake porin n=1 Tax=Anabaena sp. CCY 9402-a TaxID=3103867 RepID=UPI0039C6C690